MAGGGSCMHPGGCKVESCGAAPTWTAGLEWRWSSSPGKGRVASGQVRSSLLAERQAGLLMSPRSQGHFCQLCSFWFCWSPLPLSQAHTQLSEGLGHGQIWVTIHDVLSHPLPFGPKALKLATMHCMASVCQALWDLKVPISSVAPLGRWGYRCRHICEYVFNY